MDYKISDLGTSLLDAEPDVFDPDFICNVRATPKAIPALVSSEIGEYYTIYLQRSCPACTNIMIGVIVFAQFLLTKPARCKVGFDQTIMANSTFH